MEKFVRGIKKIRINETWFMVCSFALLAAALLPLYRLGLYSCPFYDDYGAAIYVKNFMQQDGFRGIFEGIFYHVRTSWYAWQGTYSSIGFMCLAPMVFGEQYYFIGSWVIISMLALSVFIFTFRITRLFAEANRRKACIIANIVTVFLIELIYTAHQGFYWYNGAVHYTLMYSFMLLMFTVCLDIIYAKDSITVAALQLPFVVLTFIVAGANFVVALQGLLISLIAVAFGAIKKNRKTFAVIPGMLVYFVGLYFNLAAPGNSVRAANYAGYPAVKAILCSFVEAVKAVPRLTGLITIVIIAVMLPVLWNIALKSRFAFKFPAIVTVFSFCLFATGYTPSLYGMGFAGLDRTFNAVKFTFQLLLVINEFYWLGWYSKRRADKGKENSEMEYNVVYYFACICLALVVFVTSDNQAGSFSSYGAWFYVHTGEAANFRQEHLNRLEIIEEGEGLDVVVSAHCFRPWLLCGKDELSSDPTAEQNRFAAEYYGLKSIRIRTEEDP